MSVTVEVAVYGTLRTGQGNWSYLLAPQEGKKIVIEGFKMHSLGGFPGIFRTNKKEDSIVAEIFEVDEETLRNLDRLEGFQEGTEPIFYNREELWLDGPETDEPTFIYTYVNEERLKTCPEIPDGDWVKYVESRRHNYV